MKRFLTTFFAVWGAIAASQAQERPDSAALSFPPISVHTDSFGLPTSPFSADFHESLRFDPLSTDPFAMPHFEGMSSDRPLFPVDPLRNYTQPRNSFSAGNYSIMPLRRSYLNSDDLGLSQTYRLADGLVLQSDAFLSTGRFSPHHGRYYEGSLNAQLRYEIYEGLTLNVFGQYSTSPFLTSSAFSTSVYGINYGASLDYRIFDYLSVEAGVTRTYFMGDWLTNAYVAPVIHIGNVAIPIPILNINLDGRSSSEYMTAPHGAPTPTAGNGTSTQRLPYDR